MYMLIQWYAVVCCYMKCGIAALPHNCIFIAIIYKYAVFIVWLTVACFLGAVLANKLYP